MPPDDTVLSLPENCVSSSSNQTLSAVNSTSGTIVRVFPALRSPSVVMVLQ